MKIVHFADLHIGVENYSKTDPTTGLSSRLLDFLRSFDFITDYIIDPKNKIDLVVFAGDAFKTREPTPTHVREFAKRIKKIISNNIPVILLVGNHDLPAVNSKANTLDIFSTLKIPGVVLIKQPRVETLEIKGEKIQIAGFPWQNKADLIDIKSLSKVGIGKSQELVEGKIAKILKDLSAQINPDYKSILAAHLSVAGAKYSSEQEIMLGGDLTVKLSDLAKTRFNYIALGHIHKFQIIANKPLTVYSGSIERIDFGEEKEDKGFLVIEINNNHVNYQFIKTPARCFKTIEIKLAAHESNPTKKIITEIKKNKITDCIVKIKISGNEDVLVLVEKSKVQDELTDAYLIVSIILDITDRFKREEIPYFEKNLSVLELIEAFCKNRKINAKKISQLQKYAKYLLEESEK